MKPLSLLLLLGAALVAAEVSVTTSRYSNLEDGANLRETTLNVHNVNSASFGKLFAYSVDGSVYAQPLYLPNVAISGSGNHNVVYLATMNDRVYAFDADAAGAPLWMRDFTDPAAGIMSVPIVDITHNNNLNVVGNVGIMGTPVIDASAHLIYLVARTKENGAYVQRLHALDTRDGKDRAAAVTISATVNGSVSFNPMTNNQRPALTLVRGAVLIAWASHEDIDPYHGWIMAYDAKTLQQRAVFCTTPNGKEGGVWQSGRGAAVDSKGNIYYEIGNGDWNGKTDFGESLVKLQLKRDKFKIAGFYTPADYQELNKRDADFGSSGPLFIPGTSIIICGDKHGALTLLNSKDLGKALQTLPVRGGRVLGGPVLWQQNLYIWGEADVLKAFRFNGHTIEEAAFAKASARAHGSPGGALTLSADGNRPGTGIIWGMLTTSKSADHGNAAGSLHAFDAETLTELWNTEQNAERDRLGTLVKFVPPTVVNGKVYAPSYDNQVIVYGRLAAH